MSSPQEKFETALTSLKKERLRITEPRKALLQLLVESKMPQSADELHISLGPDHYDLVTVYRNLEAFEKAGIVNRMTTESGSKSLYELNEESHHYHHIICRKCHRAEKLDVCEMEKLEKLAANLGYSEVTHVLELYGLCQDCR
ncbi:MAG: Fur family transcriptional regulator [Verrucomicrobiota bacterium]